MIKRVLAILSLVAIMSTQSQSQCPGALTCEGSGVLCSIDALNGFSCNNPGFPNVAFPFPNLCFGAGVPHNLNWWAFIGNGTPLTLTFNFNPASCELGQGIQAGVFEGSCDGSNVWDCNAACNTSTFSLSGATKACEIYFVWVDGCNGDVCQYTMSVNGNGGPPMLQRPMPPLRINGEPCACGTVEVCFPGYNNDCSPYFEWTVDGVPTGGPDDECVEVMIPENVMPGTRIEVCLTATIGNPFVPESICDQDFTCTTIIPTPPEMHFGDCRVVCFEDRPVLWHGIPINSSCINPPCSVRTTISGQDCCVDSFKQFILLPPPGIGAKDTFVCDPNIPIVTEDGSVHRGEVCDELIEFEKRVINTLCPSPPKMCDTSYYLTIGRFDFDFDWEVDCGACSGKVELCPNVEYVGNCPQFFGQVSITLSWFNQLTGDQLGITDGMGCIEVSEPGQYCFYPEGRYRSTTCPIFVPVCYTIPADFFPPDPPLTGTDTLCADRYGVYETEARGDICDYVWVVQSGGGRVITPNSLDSNRVTIDWENRTGNQGIVCVQTIADCGTTDSCITVTFLPAPRPDAGPDQVVCGQTTNFEGVEDYGGGSWTQVSGPNMATILNPSDVNSQVDVNRYGTFEFVWSETNLDCSGTDTVSILFAEDPEPANIDTICSSDATQFTVRFEIERGTAPYTIVTGGGTITMDSVYRSDVIADNTPTTITIRDDNGCEFTYFIDHDCVCNNAPGDMATDTIKLCGPDAEGCGSYDPTNMVLENVDTFMYVLYETVGMIEQTLLASNHTGCFTFDPNTMNMDQVYYIGVVVGRKGQDGNVDFNGGCLQPAEAQPIIWYTIPTPDAGPNDSICGKQIDLTGLTSVTGSRYRWLNTTGANFSSQTSLNTTVNVTDFGVYRFIIEEVNGVCPNTDTVTIAFNESPSPENIVPECIDLVNNTYQVCFTITGGTAPYVIVSGNGTITNGDEFCSDILDGDVPYDIIVRDANGCEFTLPVEYSCDCGDTEVGTMDTTLLEACIDECVNVTSNGSEVLQPDEVAYFVLHEGSGPFLQNEIIRIPYDHNANPAEVVQFCFDATAGMVTNQRYYISRLVHEVNAPDDPCRRIAPGQPAIWYDYPNADAGADTDFCGLSGNLAATPSLGDGTWTLVNGPGNAVFAGGVATQMITVDAYGTYTFRWTEDNHSCQDNDEVELTFHDAPIVTNVEFVCDDVAENYVIRFTVTNGEAATYAISGLPGVTQIGQGLYESQPIPTGSAVNFCATDQWDCSPFCVDTSFVCECITAPGTVTSDDILCIDECVQATHNGGTLDPNDVLRFVLHDGDANNVGTVIECNANGEFCFDQFAMTANTTYYIAVMAGNPDNGNCVDLTERCAVVTNGVPVTWYEYPTPDISQSEPEFTCEIDSMILDGIGSTGPGSLSYQWTALNGQLCPSADPSSPNVQICAAGTYVLTVTHELSGCATSDTITITADENIPSVSGGNDLLLTCDQTTVTLDGTGTDFGGDFQVSWLDPQDNVISNELTVTVSEPGTYRIYVINDITNCDNVDEVEVTQDIMPPTAAIVQDGELTCSVEQVELSAASSSTRGGVRTYSWSTTNGAISGSNTGPTVQVTDPGVYQVIVIDDINGCADTTTIPVEEVGNTFVNFEITPTPPTCFGDANGIIVVDSTFGGLPPLEYSFDGGPYGSSNVFTNLAPGDYRIRVRDRNGCEMDTLINVPETPEIGIEAKEDLFKEAGENVGLDTLIHRIFGVDPADADSILWFDAETGDRYSTNSVLDSLGRKYDLRVELWKNGCVDVDFLTIFVKFTKRVYIPNVIVPGSGGGIGDNPNTYLTIHANQNRIVNINFLRVYDRWGELVYSSDNIPYDDNRGRSLEGWDGTFNGELVNPGVFVYHFQVEFLGGAVEDFFGDITVLTQAP